MDRKGRNYDKEEIPGSGQSIKAKALACSGFSKEKTLITASEVPGRWTPRSSDDPYPNSPLSDVTVTKRTIH